MFETLKHEKEERQKKTQKKITQNIVEKSSIIMNNSKCRLSNDIINKMKTLIIIITKWINGFVINTCKITMKRLLLLLKRNNEKR